MPLDAKEYYKRQFEKATETLKQIDEDIYMLKLRRKAVRSKQIRMCVRYNDCIPKPIVDVLED